VLIWETQIIARDGSVRIESDHVHSTTERILGAASCHVGDTTSRRRRRIARRGRLAGDLVVESKVRELGSGRSRETIQMLCEFGGEGLAVRELRLEGGRLIRSRRGRCRGSSLDRIIIDRRSSPSLGRPRRSSPCCWCWLGRCLSRHGERRVGGWPSVCVMSG
jgi:hypothetical protein